jgi:hypothetical protein
MLNAEMKLAFERLSFELDEVTTIMESSQQHDVQDRNKCVVCMVDDAKRALLGCGCLVCCDDESCVQGLRRRFTDTCPCCRGNRRKLYYGSGHNMCRVSDLTASIRS